MPALRETCVPALTWRTGAGSGGHRGSGVHFHLDAAVLGTRRGGVGLIHWLVRTQADNVDAVDRNVVFGTRSAPRPRPAPAERVVVCPPPGVGKAFDRDKEPLLPCISAPVCPARPRLPSSSDPIGGKRHSGRGLHLIVVQARH